MISLTQLLAKRAREVLLAMLLVASSASSEASNSHVPNHANTSLILSATCPKGFYLSNENTCKLNKHGIFAAVNKANFRDGFSPQQIDLGRYLFFDTRLSGDGTISCASCHQPEKSFTDGLATSIGADGTHGKRSAPSLWNVGFATHFFWDARADSLEQQSASPLFSATEMNNTATKLLSSLKQNVNYRAMFTSAFKSQNSITLDNIYTALAAFQSSLVSLNSRYDQFIKGEQDTLDSDQIEGLAVFNSFAAKCAECHTPPLFSNAQVAVIGAPESHGQAFDIGAQETFNNPALRGGFKVPSLRNIAKTAPYMHSGAFASLRDAIEFYNKPRGHAAPTSENLNIHWQIGALGLSEREIKLLEKFLHSLTDESLTPQTPTRQP